MWIALLIFMWIYYQVCKGLTDGFLFGDKTIRLILEKHGLRWIDWYDGKRGLLTEKVNQGYPWSADYWHHFDGMRNLVAVLAMPVSIIALSGWLWWEILLFSWFCFWIPIFTLVFHVILLKDWTLKKWIINNFQIWK